MESNQQMTSDSGSGSDWGRPFAPTTHPQIKPRGSCQAERKPSQIAVTLLSCMRTAKTEFNLKP